MPKTMRALPTYHAGCHFRSRIEARWSVVYDALGIEWRYEAQGFALPAAGAYLPDFELPGLHAYVEIKGDRPTGREIGLAYELARASESRVFLFFGDIPEMDWTQVAESVQVWTDVGWSQGSAYVFAWDPLHQHVRVESGAHWRECPDCGHLEPRPPHDTICRSGKCASMWMEETERIAIAFAAARSARFEHGETPIAATAEEREVRDRRQRAELLLVELLQHGPRPAAEVFAEAEQRGIAKKTLDQAKGELGVSSFRVEGNPAWFWGLGDLSKHVSRPA